MDTSLVSSWDDFTSTPQGRKGRYESKAMFNRLLTYYREKLIQMHNKWGGQGSESTKKDARVDAAL